MTHEASRLTNLRSTDVNDITVANSEVMKVESVGDTTLHLGNNAIAMQNVLHVSELGMNLLSVSQIVSKGNTVLFNKSGCTIRNTNGETVVHTQVMKCD